MQEQIVCREGLDCGDGTSILRQRRPDDGNRRQIRAKEFTWFGQDQVGLEHLTTGSLVSAGELCIMLVCRIIEIWERKAGLRVGQPIWARQRLGYRIASFIVPE